MSGLNPARLPLIVSHTSGTFCGIVGRARVRLFLTFVFCHDKARKGVRKVRNERSKDRECSIELESHTWTASTTQVQIGNKTRREERRKECVRIICHFQFGQQNKVQLPGAKVEKKTHTHTLYCSSKHTPLCLPPPPFTSDHTALWQPAWPKAT